jgi:hypothetical protein
LLCLYVTTPNWKIDDEERKREEYRKKKHHRRRRDGWKQNSCKKMCVKKEIHQQVDIEENYTIHVV